MSDQAGKREFLGSTEKEIYEEARDRLKINLDAESDNRAKAKEDLKFREGDQWESDTTTTASMDTPELTINLTDALVRRVVNNIKQQRPRGKCHPTGDGARIEIAEIINGIGRHVEYRSEAGVAYDTAADHATTMGFGYVRMISEYVAPDSFDQDIRILPVFNAFTVYMDPAAVMPTGSDANWCIVSVKMKRTEYKRQYPKADNVAWVDIGWEERVDWEEKEEIRLAEYFRIREKSEKLFLLRDSQGTETTRFKSEMPSAESLAAAGLTVVDQRDSSRRTVEWFKLNGTRVIDAKEIPGSWIPIIRCQGNAVDIDGKVVRRGMVRGMQDPARMVNYGEVAKIKRLGLTPQAPWVAAEGQLDGHPEWANANREALAVLTYKPVTVQTDAGEVLLPPPDRQPPAQIEAGFAEFTAGMRSNLLAVAGMPNEPGQDEKGQVVSGRAIRRRQQLSDQSHFQYYDNQTLMIAQVWRIMLEWIPHYLSEERIQRIIGEDGVPKMVRINEQSDDNGVKAVKNDITVGRYDVVMDTGPGYETKREEGAEALLDLINSKLGDVIAKMGPDLVVRAIDAPYMQELADRLIASTPDGLKKILDELPDRARAIVQSLAAENDQLKQALQAAQVEIKQGITKEHLKAAVKAHDVEETNKTKRYDTELRAQTSLHVAEIKAGAQLLNAHVEAEHNQAAADRLIERADKAGESAVKPNGAAPQ